MDGVTLFVAYFTEPMLGITLEPFDGPLLKVREGLLLFSGEIGGGNAGAETVLFGVSARSGKLSRCEAWLPFYWKEGGISCEGPDSGLLRVLFAAEVMGESLGKPSDGTVIFDAAGKPLACVGRGVRSCVKALYRDQATGWLLAAGDEIFIKQADFDGDSATDDYLVRIESFLVCSGSLNDCPNLAITRTAGAYHVLLDYRGIKTDTIRLGSDEIRSSLLGGRYGDCGHVEDCVEEDRFQWQLYRWQNGAYQESQDYPMRILDLETFPFIESLCPNLKVPDELDFQFEGVGVHASPFLWALLPERCFADSFGNRLALVMERKKTEWEPFYDYDQPSVVVDWDEQLARQWGTWRVILAVIASAGTGPDWRGWQSNSSEWDGLRQGIGLELPWLDPEACFDPDVRLDDPPRLLAFDVGWQIYEPFWRPDADLLRDVPSEGTLPYIDVVEFVGGLELGWTRWMRYGDRFLPCYSEMIPIR